jgi:hypothetical protein
LYGLGPTAGLGPTRVVSTFQFGTSSSTSFPVFFILGAISLGFSLALYLKSRAIKRIPRDLSATVFNKTFNVFDPFPEHRRTIQSEFFFILFSPLITLVWVFLIVFIALLWVLEAGLLAQLIISLFFVGLMMVGEATETYSTVNTLVKATKRHTGFGQGDIFVLSVVKKTIDKLSLYYLLLSVLSVALSFAMPYMFPAMMLAFSQFISLMVGATGGIPMIAPFAAAALFTLFTIAIFEAAKRLKTAFFGFLPPDIFETDEIMARWILHERA